MSKNKKGVIDKSLQTEQQKEQSILGVDINQKLKYQIEENEKLKTELTEIKKQLKKLKNQQSLLDFKELQINQIIDSAPTAISFIDKSYKYIFTNRAYKTWFGQTLDGLKVYDFVGTDHFNKYGKVYLDKAFEGKSVQQEIKIETNGKVFHLMVHYAPAQNTKSEIIGAYIFAVEINEIKETQAMLELKNKELQRYIDSYLQLENFAHIASHDLKAPLKTVVSFSELLSTKMEGRLDKNESKYLDFIKSSALNMQSTIKGLLEFSLLSNREPIFKKVSPNKILSSLLNDLNVVISENNADISINKLPSEINADPVLLKQLFQNLILNAIKFCDNGIPTISIYSSEDESKYWFHVEDNGIGIETKHFDKIFAVFEQLHSKDQYKGTGLGLALSKKIAQHHRGVLLIKSKIGQGSTFYFSIDKQLNQAIDLITT